MLPTDGATVCQELASVCNRALHIAAVYNAQLRRYILLRSSDGSSSRNDDLVVTPGGLRPRDRVHPVGPGETVRRNDDGTYTIVPKEAPVEEREEKEEK